MASLEGIVPGTVVDQLHLVEELAAAPLEDLRPLLAIVLATFLIERRQMELPHLFVDAIDATLRKVRDKGQAALKMGGEESSPLQMALSEHRRWIAEQQETGLMAREDRYTAPEEGTETAYQPKQAEEPTSMAESAPAS